MAASPPGPAAWMAAASLTSCGAASRPASVASLLGRVEQALASVRSARLLHDISLVDQLLEDAAQALLGDVEHVEQVGDCETRMAIDEMQHAVMRPAEAEILEDRVGVTGEIAIGEEQELGEGEQLRLGQGRAFAGRSSIAAPPSGRGFRGPRERLI